MPTNITLKNVPDAVYVRLKAAAEAHRRSLNSEAIVCLEAVLLHGRPPVADRLSTIRDMRTKLGQTNFNALDIEAFKNEGRK